MERSKIECDIKGCNKSIEWHDKWGRHEGDQKYGTGWLMIGFSIKTDEYRSITVNICPEHAKTVAADSLARILPDDIVTAIRESKVGW